MYVRINFSVLFPIQIVKTPILKQTYHNSRSRMKTKALPPVLQTFSKMLQRIQAARQQGKVTTIKLMSFKVVNVQSKTAFRRPQCDHHTRHQQFNGTIPLPAATVSLSSKLANPVSRSSTLISIKMTCSLNRTSCRNGTVGVKF